MSIYLVKPRDSVEDEGTLIRAFDAEEAEKIFLSAAKNDRLHYSAMEAARITNAAVFEVPKRTGVRHVIGSFDAEDYDLVKSEASRTVEPVDGAKFTTICTLSLADTSGGFREFYVEASGAEDAIELLKSHEAVQDLEAKGEIKTIQAVELPAAYGKDGIVNWPSSFEIQSFEDDTPRP